jgi:replicative DNA helicase
VFARARGQLRAQHFSDIEMPVACLWATMLELHHTNALSPERLVAEAPTRVAGSTTAVPCKAADQIRTLITEAFDRPAAEFSETDGRELLRRFLIERAVWDPLQRIFAEAADASTVPLNLSALLKTHCDRLAALDRPHSKFRVYSPDEFERTEFTSEWLLEDFLLKGQPAIVAGPAKSLKTSLIAEMAVCMGLGTTRLFGHFPINRPPRRVGFISGESGEATLKDTLRRICASRCTTISSSNVWICFRLPSVATELDELTDMICTNAWDVVILDPLYLCLLVGEPDAAAASKLHSVGPLLSELCSACLERGCTPILVHHTTKYLGGRRRSERFEPLELSDMHGAGTTEFARQWLLINRREPFEDGSKVERVWFRVGGSQGQSGLWALDVDQGKFRSETRTREHWHIAVHTEQQARQLAAQRRANRHDERSAAVDADLEQRLLDALRGHPAGETEAKLKRSAGINKNTPVLHILDQLVQERQLERSVERRRVGSCWRQVTVYRMMQNLAQAHPQSRAPSEPAEPGERARRTGRRRVGAWRRSREEGG